MNFTKKRNIVIEFIKNIKETLIILLGITCLIYVPYLYALALGYNTDVLSDIASVWIRGFFLILFGAAIPTALLLMVIEDGLIAIKISKISCKLPVTEKEMDEFAKNKTCEEIIMDMEKFLTFSVLGEEYCLYYSPKHMELLKPFYSYIKDNYTSEEIGTASELAKKIQYMGEQEVYLIPK